MSNLNILIIILTNIIAPQLACPFVGLCFGHTMSKVAQHATNYFKFCARFLEGA
jgi:hypothetical protein